MTHDAHMQVHVTPVLHMQTHRGVDIIQLKKYLSFKLKESNNTHTHRHKTKHLQ